jgi:para-nitrobenzyl esterase
MGSFHRRGVLAAGAGLGLAAALEGRAWSAVPQPSAVIATAHGPVQGLIEAGIHAFNGLRYGAAPTGEHRFKPPRAPEAWSERHAALGYGAPAIQMVGGTTAYPPTDVATALHTIFPASSEINYDNEDCLFLNVWTPGTDAGARPVMVWLHGGGFAYGSGAWPLYDGANLARRGDVVVVTVNHRLNAFGYLDLSQIGGEAYAQSGNAGMLDIVLALEWVKANIAKFGGDPGNVTIMGESGGGAKVSVLCAMPAAAGLFHKAIIQSGAGLKGQTRAQAKATTDAILGALGVTPDTFDKLLTLPADAILAAAVSTGRQAEFGRLSPRVDGVVLPRDPFAPDAPAVSADVPILIGWNKDEFSLFNTGAPWWGTLTDEQLRAQLATVAGEKAARLERALRATFPDYSPTYLMNAAISSRVMFIDSVILAERKAALRRAPAYMYNLTWETPVAGGVFKCPHTLDIPFMMDNIDKAEVFVSSGDGPAALRDQMAGAWIAFAKTGNPGHAGLPDWPAYDARMRATMRFDTPPSVVNDPLRDVRRVLAA